MRKFVLIAAFINSFTILYGCQQSESAATNHKTGKPISQLAKKTRSNLVFIEGGSFIMGDFGAVGKDGIWRPYFPQTIEEDQPHEVTLSDFSLSRHKATWGDFDTYLLANNLDVIERNFNDLWKRDALQQDSSSEFYIDKPARVTWQEAKDFCRWLGQETGLLLDLPTSAQWEFAGRNRGSREWIYSTHDGQPLSAHPELSERMHDGGDYVPVGSRLPPNPLGIYDMADNGKEWVNDWFSETWYRDNPKITDPQGPDEGTMKVIRNLDFSFSRIGVPESTPSAFNENWSLIITNTFRCALQSPVPVAGNDQ